MKFDEILPHLVTGERVRCEDWGDDEFIWRCPEDKYPEWNFYNHFKHKPFKEFNDRSIYDEDGNEVLAVTIIENVDSNWELF